MVDLGRAAAAKNASIAISLQNNCAFALPFFGVEIVLVIELLSLLLAAIGLPLLRGKLNDLKNQDDSKK